MKAEDRIEYLKQCLRQTLDLFYKEKTTPKHFFSKKKVPFVFQGEDAFKDSGIVAKAELAISGLYHIKEKDTPNSATYYDENEGMIEKEIQKISMIKCQYHDLACMVNDTVYGSSCGCCHLNPNRTSAISFVASAPTKH